LPDRDIAQFVEREGDARVHRSVYVLQNCERLLKPLLRLLPLTRHRERQFLRFFRDLLRNLASPILRETMDFIC
jgi:hypothetical protein